jgi:uncharacterized protein (DUF58 family)
MVGWQAPGRRVEVSRAAMALVVAAVAAGWAGRQTGDRLFLLAQVGLFAVPVIDGLWSAVVAVRARTTVTSVVPDAVVGQALRAEVAVACRRPLLVRLATSAGGAWADVETPAEGPVEAVAPARGVLTHVVVEVLSKAPLGLVGLTQRREVALPQVVLVGPHPIPCPEVTFPPGLAADDGEVGAVTGHQVVRGVREHLPGAPLRLVHWPTTARTGRLAVKELEEPRRPRAAMVLVVDLGGGTPGTEVAVETAAGKGSWIAAEALRRGYRVVLATREAHGPVTAEVPSPLAAARRLARAVPGTPEPPPGNEAVTLTVAVAPSLGPT